MNDDESPPGLHCNPDMAAEMAVNAVLNYTRNCGLTSKEEILKWVNQVFEIVRERLNVVN